MEGIYAFNIGYYYNYNIVFSIVNELFKEITQSYS